MRGWTPKTTENSFWEASVPADDDCAFVSLYFEVMRTWDVLIKLEFNGRGTYTELKVRRACPQCVI